ncbi:MAG: hypothetical protein WCK47_04475 [bacterium]|nr:hypothetical protein [Candidatus Sumerlaeota bacterium]
MMKSYKLFTTAGLVSLALMFAMPALGNIYMDENFENGTAFANLNYPVQDDTTMPSESAIAASQGINVRATDSVAAGAPIVAMNNTGTISTDYAFSGTHSLKLASGQAATVDNNSYHNYALNWYCFVQFALTVDSATLALPVGTRVGHYKENWATDVSLAVSVVYQLDFVRNATGGVDIIVDNNSAKAGTITGAGKWAVISVINDKNTSQSVSAGIENWECWDPLTLTYKGPQPTGDPFGGSGTYATLTDGIMVFVNNNTIGNQVSAEQLGHNWCDDPTQPDPTAKSNNTYFLNWEVAAENGGALFVDEFFWAHGWFAAGKGTAPSNQDCAARLVKFDAAPLSVAEWNLF